MWHCCGQEGWGTDTGGICEAGGSGTLAGHRDVPENVAGVAVMSCKSAAVAAASSWLAAQHKTMLLRLYTLCVSGLEASWQRERMS